MSLKISKLDRFLARNCLNCPVCKKARKNQAGIFFWLVRQVESHLCPQCRAYEKVYGQKAHEPLGKTDS